MLASPARSSIATISNSKPGRIRSDLRNRRADLARGRQGAEPGDLGEARGHPTCGREARHGHLHEAQPAAEHRGPPSSPRCDHLAERLKRRRPPAEVRLAAPAHSGAPVSGALPPAFDHEHTVPPGASRSRRHLGAAFRRGPSEGMLRVQVTHSQKEPKCPPQAESAPTSRCAQSGQRLLRTIRRRRADGMPRTSRMALQERRPASRSLTRR
jgi:hypothetical protein